MGRCRLFKPKEAEEIGSRNRPSPSGLGFALTPDTPVHSWVNSPEKKTSATTSCGRVVVTKIHRAKAVGLTATPKIERRGKNFQRSSNQPLGK